MVTARKLTNFNLVMDKQEKVQLEKEIEEGSIDSCKGPGVYKKLPMKNLKHQASSIKPSEYSRLIRNSAPPIFSRISMGNMSFLNKTKTESQSKVIKIKKTTDTGTVKLFRLKTRKPQSKSDLKNSAILDIETWISFMQGLYFKGYCGKNLVKELNSKSRLPGLLNITFFCIEVNSLHLFVETMLFIADNLLGFNLPDSAFAVCLQLVNLCELNSNDAEKAFVYIKIADICFHLTEFGMSILFLQKAIELCWIFDLRGLELVIYDRLGLNYYRLGRLQEAKYYHDK